MDAPGSAAGDRRRESIRRGRDEKREGDGVLCHGAESRRAPTRARITRPPSPKNPWGRVGSQDSAVRRAAAPPMRSSPPPSAERGRGPGGGGSPAVHSVRQPARNHLTSPGGFGGGREERAGGGAGTPLAPSTVALGRAPSTGPAHNSFARNRLRPGGPADADPARRAACVAFRCRALRPATNPPLSPRERGGRGACDTPAPAVPAR